MMVALVRYACCEGERSSRQIERRCREDIAFRVLPRTSSPTTPRSAASGSSTSKRWRDCSPGCSGCAPRRVCCYSAWSPSTGRSCTPTPAVSATARMRSLRPRCGASSPRRSGWTPRSTRASATGGATSYLRGSGTARNASGAARRRTGAGAARSSPQPDRGAKVNVTDPDSRVVRDYYGYFQGYNVQAVTSREQIIVAAEVTRAATDMHELQPMIEAMHRNLRAAHCGPPRVLLADAGYYSEANVRQAEGSGPGLLLADCSAARRMARRRPQAGCPWRTRHAPSRAPRGESGRIGGCGHGCSSRSAHLPLSYRADPARRERISAHGAGWSSAGHAAGPLLPAEPSPVSTHTTFAMRSRHAEREPATPPRLNCKKFEARVIAEIGDHILTASNIRDLVRLIAEEMVRGPERREPEARSRGEGVGRCPPLGGATVACSGSFRHGGRRNLAAAQAAAIASEEPWADGRRRSCRARGAPGVGRQRRDPRRLRVGAGRPHRVQRRSPGAGVPALVHQGDRRHVRGIHHPLHPPHPA